MAVNTPLTVLHVVNTGASKIFMSKEIVMTWWQELIKLLNLPPLRIYRLDIAKIGTLKCIMNLIVEIWDWRVGTWFRIVKNLGVHVLLVTWLFDKYIPETIQTYGKLSMHAKAYCIQYDEDGDISNLQSH